MSIIDFIEKNQNKPEESRKKILGFTVFIIMMTVVAVWLGTLNFSLFSDNRDGRTARPFSFLKEDIKEFYGFIKGSTTK